VQTHCKLVVAVSVVCSTHYTVTSTYVTRYQNTHYQKSK